MKIAFLKEPHEKLNESNIVPRIVLCGIGGSLISIANSAAVSSYSNIKSVATWAAALVFAVGLFVIFTLASNSSAISDIPESPGKKNLRICFYWNQILNSKKNTIFFFSIILLCWLPYIILLRPGTLSWDTGDQLAQFFGISAFGYPGGTIYNHHPFIDTYIFGFFALLGIKTTGKILSGLFLLVLLQNISMAATYAFGFSYIQKNFRIKNGIFAISFLVVALSPIMPIYMCLIVKDSLHLVFLAPWSLMYVHLCRTKLNALTSIKFDIFFLATSTLVSLTKGTGVIVVTLSCLLLVFVPRSRKLSKVFAVTIGLFCFSLTSFIIPKFYSALNIVPTDSQQYFVIPLQLTARFATEHPEDATAEEKQVIDDFNLYTFDQMGNQYNPFSTDPVTMYKLKDPSKSLDYLKVWASQGLRHPMSYIDSLASIESGWFAFAHSHQASPLTEPYDVNTNQFTAPTISQSNHDTYGKLGQSDGSGRDVTSVLNTYLYFLQTPLVNTLASTPVWTWILPLFIAFTLLRNKQLRSRWIWFMPYLLCMLSLYACSVSYISRYALPMLALGPLFVSLGVGHEAQLLKEQEPRTDIIK